MVIGHELTHGFDNTGMLHMAVCHFHSCGASYDGDCIYHPRVNGVLIRVGKIT